MHNDRLNLPFSESDELELEILEITWTTAENFTYNNLNSFETLLK